MAWLARDISNDWLASAPDEALVWFLGRLCPFFFAFYSLILTMCFHRVLFSDDMASCLLLPAIF
jgi:hypothetical protein